MVTDSDRQFTRVEELVRELLQRGDVSVATNMLVAEHGAEVFGFLVAVLDDAKAARVIYADLCGRAATELSLFAWACPLRVWWYALARRTLREHRRPAEQVQELTTTEGDLRVKDLVPVVATVRRALSVDERALVILRIDRAFDWEQLAITELGARSPIADIAYEARIVRTRFEQLLERIRDLAEQELRPR